MESLENAAIGFDLSKDPQDCAFDRLITRNDQKVAEQEQMIAQQKREYDELQRKYSCALQEFQNNCRRNEVLEKKLAEYEARFGKLD